MASASDYLETRILDFFLKNNSLSTSAPNPIYVALFTGDPTDSAGLTDFANEVSTSGSSNYARTQVSFGTIDTQAGSVSNSGAVTFPVAGANYNGTVTHVAIVDNATAMRTAREQIYAVRKIDCFKDMAREVYQKLGSRKKASKRPRTSGNKAQPKLI